MKIRYKLALFISLLAFLQIANASTIRNGTASYSDLGTEVFLGSIYLESPAKDAGVLLESTQEKVLEVSVMNTISKRRWVNMWMQSIAINNPRSDFEQHAETLVEFFKVFKTGLKKGDVFKLTSIPNKGVEITLDSVTILDSKDESLFNLFARAWIGAVPPSREFKDQILGITDSSFLSSRIGSISPSASRIATIKEWLVSEEEKAERERLAQEKLEQERLAKEQKQKELEEQKLAKQKAQEEAELLATEAEKAAALAEAATSADDEESEGTEEVAQVEEEEDFGISVESILAQQNYTNNIISSIYQKIVYPNSALRRGEQGTARITLTVDRDGKLVETGIEQESGVASLDKAAINAINKAAPFDAFPEVLQEESQQFIIPVTFTLQ